jgi:hypothetical protein
MEPISQAEKQLTRKSSAPGLSQFIRAVSAVIWKDLAAELRSRELLSAMLVFALLVILVFNFAWSWMRVHVPRSLQVCSG